ncbi:hypothetical protein AKO1_007921 [Acrasis kona]|uniref:non-specific serine/threonine protein kinase n=1 Tax=Acrasis kona TaxID=1008807 RepID=A0AAW2YQB6_9EUKA
MRLTLVRLNDDRTKARAIQTNIAQVEKSLDKLQKAKAQLKEHIQGCDVGQQLDQQIINQKNVAEEDHQVVVEELSNALDSRPIIDHQQLEQITDSLFEFKRDYPESHLVQARQHLVDEYQEQLKRERESITRYEQAKQKVISSRRELRAAEIALSSINLEIEEQELEGSSPSESIKKRAIKRNEINKITRLVKVEEEEFFAAGQQEHLPEELKHNARSVANVRNQLRIQRQESNMIGDYKIIEELQHGAQAKVYLCENANRDRVVVKAYTVVVASDIQVGMKECITVQSIQHQNVITILDYFTEHTSTFQRFCLVTPHYQGGDMDALLSRARLQNQNIPAPVVLRIAHQLASGLEVIHAKGIIHRDIKPKNIYLTPEGESLVIGDFGLAKSSNNKIIIAGEEDYMSFEMKSKKPYSGQTDMWSFGCVLYELMSLKHKNMSNDYLEAIADERLSEFRSELKQDMNISGIYPQPLIELVIKLLQRRDVDRPTASHIMQMRDLFGGVEVVRADEQQECVICMDAAKSHACSPCGHKVVCEECAERVYERGVCPICRAEVIHCIRIFE